MAFTTETRLFIECDICNKLVMINPEHQDYGESTQDLFNHYEPEGWTLSHCGQYVYCSEHPERSENEDE